MDMIAVDLTACKDADSWTPVQLWGPGLPVEIIAQHADTIPYELVCGINKRVRVIYS